MGYSIPKSQYVYETLGHLFDKIDQTNYKTLLMGLTWWFMLWAARQLALKKKKYCSWLRPCAPLIVCTLGIVVGGTWEDLGGELHSKPTQKSHVPHYHPSFQPTANPLPTHCPPTVHSAAHPTAHPSFQPTAHPTLTLP